MSKDATLTTQQALKLAKERGVDVSRVTIVNWCNQFNGLGFQIGGRGPWRIYEKRFKLLLDGKSWEKN